MRRNVSRGAMRRLFFAAFEDFCANESANIRNGTSERNLCQRLGPQFAMLTRAANSMLSARNGFRSDSLARIASAAIMLTFSSRRSGA
ncbi:hypothetical protein E5675_16170 [Sphingopyxis sp. PAMC25046]|uniref:hypothetical protein n=1 Tax=Sphingopyxis sp. PAMC25046 TaxID=2565556 RepID=UPI00109DB70E|nr:hypothetical protein [Sphingopyxis sp. PAMC25046]QCB55816.1 hypothetical protein E5675_16170 [Sphingopyxis sp. PAMC25046]